MAKDEIDVVAIKNSIPDLRGQHLWLFLQTYGAPSTHAICYGRYAGYETYSWAGCGGEVEYYFDSRNLCVTDNIFEFLKMFG